MLIGLTLQNEIFDDFILLVTIQLCNKILILKVRKFIELFYLTFWNIVEFEFRMDIYRALCLQGRETLWLKTRLFNSRPADHIQSATDFSLAH